METFFRSELLLVKFSGGDGSIRGKHYAVVVSKGDTEIKSDITVVPLTSQYHVSYIKLGVVKGDTESYACVGQIMTIGKKIVIEHSGQLKGEQMALIDASIINRFVNGKQPIQKIRKGYILKKPE